MFVCDLWSSSGLCFGFWIESRREGAALKKHIHMCCDVYEDVLCCDHSVLQCSGAKVKKDVVHLTNKERAYGGKYSSCVLVQHGQCMDNCLARNNFVWVKLDKKFIMITVLLTNDIVNTFRTCRMLSSIVRAPSIRSLQILLQTSSSIKGGQHVGGQAMRPLYQTPFFDICFSWSTQSRWRQVRQVSVDCLPGSCGLESSTSRQSRRWIGLSHLYSYYRRRLVGVLGRYLVHCPSCRRDGLCGFAYTFVHGHTGWRVFD